MLTDNAARRLQERQSEKLPDFESTTPKDLDKLLGGDTVHQGAVLETSHLEEPTLETLIDAAQDSAKPLIVLDQLTDPHNVGAIFRSGAVFGTSGVITTWRHSAPIDGTLAKSASGALELVPVLHVQNLARTLEQLKNAHITILGLDGGADHALEDETFQTPTAFVLGAEGKGLRELTAKTCTRLCRIEAPGALASLNVSNAAAVAFHLNALRRKKK